MRWRGWTRPRRGSIRSGWPGSTRSSTSVISRPELLAGAQLLIAREGKVVHFSTAGKARADGGPMGEDSLFRIASMTKPVTSIAFMMLVEEGKVTLDQPVETVHPRMEGPGSL